VAKVYKPNFIYIKSDLLKQEVAVNKKTGKVTCEDGVTYSPQEMKIIAEAGAVLDMATHRVKKIIGGEVVKIERAGNETSQNEGGGGENEHNNSSAVAQVPEAHGISTPNRDGELDIF
jgi:hypothetical protein